MIKKSEITENKGKNLRSLFMKIKEFRQIVSVIS